MRRRLALVLVALCAVLLLVLAALHAPPVRDLARQRAQRWLRDVANIEATIGALDYNLPSLTFDMRNITLRAASPQGRPFFRAAHIAVALDGVPPFRPFHLRVVTVEDAELLISRGAGGQLNLPLRRAGPSRSLSLAWTVPERMDVRRLAFSYHDERTGFALEMPSASWNARQNLRGLAGAFASDQFVSLAWPTRGLTLADVRAHVTWNGESVSAEAVHAILYGGAPRVAQPVVSPPQLTSAVGPAPIGTAEGSFTWNDVAGASSIQSSLGGSLNVGPLVGWLSAPLDASGTARWRGTLQGRPAALVARAQVESPSLAVRNVLGVRAASDVTVEFGSSLFVLNSATLEVAGGVIRASGRFPFGRTPTDANVDVTWARLRLPTAARALRLALPPGLDGLLAGQGAARWRYGQPESLTLSAQQNVSPLPGSMLPASGRTTVRASGNQLSVEHDHRVGSTTIRGLGATTVAGLLGGALPPGPFVAATAHVARSLDELSALGIVDRRWAGLLLAGDVEVAGRLAGSSSQPHLSATFVGRGLHARGDLIFGLEGAFVLSGARLNLSETTITHGHNRLVARGSVDVRNRTADVTATGTLSEFGTLWKMFELPPQVQPTGGLQVHAHVHGRLANPSATGAVDGMLAFGSLDRSATTAAFTLANSRLDISSLRVESAAGLATGSGSVDFSTPDRRFGATVVAAIERAEDLASAFPDTGWPLAGSWHVRGRASGRLVALSAADVDLTVEGIQGSVHQVPFLVSTAAEVERRGDRVTVSPLTVVTGATTVTVSGSLGPGAPGLTLTGDVHLKDLEPLTSHLFDEQRATLDGVLRVDAHVLGSLQRPEFEGEVLGQGISAAVAGWPALTSLAIGASLRDGRLALTRLAGRWQDADVRGSASAPLSLFDGWLPASWLVSRSSVETSARVNLEIRGLTPPALAPFVSASTLAGIGGRVSGRVSVQTERLARNAWRGDLVLDEADVTLAQIPLRQSVPTRLVLQDGRIRVDTWEWEGPGTRIAAVGGINFGASGARLDAAIDAAVDLRMASTFVRPAAVAGRADVSVSLAGPIREPIVEGRVALSDAEFRSADPRLAATEVSGSLLLIGEDIRLEGVRGQLNGGSLTIEGSGALHQWHLDSMRLSMAAQGAAVEYPAGLRSEVVADLRLTKTGDTDRPLVSGTVTAIRGSYREQFGLVSQLLAGGSRTSITSTESRVSGSLGTLRLNVGLATLEDISIETDQGRVEAGASLRVAGTVGEPELSGRINVRQGGSIFLGGTTYRVESGTVEFRGSKDFRPQLDVTATTQVGSHAIRLEMTGSPDRLRTELTSDTGLDRSNIVSLLVTGRTIDAGGLRSEVVGNQVLSYLSGDVLNFAGRALGLDSVRIDRGDSFGSGAFDPLQDTRFGVGGIAGETDPTSRLTVSKNLTRDIDVVLSQNLSDGGKLTWIATWRPRRTIAWRVLSFDDTERTYEFRQERTFGGVAERVDVAQRTEPRVVDVSFSGDGFNPDDLRTAVKLRVGSRFDFYKWQDDRDRLLRYFHERSHYEVSVLARRRETTGEGGEPAVALSYEVRPGPHETLIVNGARLSAATMAEMRSEWTRAVFDDFLKEDLARVAERGLARDGYLQPLVGVTVESTGSAPDDTKIARVSIRPGTQTTRREISWVGNEHLDAAQLEALLNRANLMDRIWKEPESVEAPVRLAYASEGFLAARVSAGLPVFSGNVVRIAVTVEEGPPARLAATTYQGVRALSVSDVSRAAGLGVNERLLPSQLESARRRIEEQYLASGFTDVRVAVQATSRPNGLVDAAIDVEEGPQQILSRIDLTGATRTHPSLITGALNLSLNEPLSTEKLYEARRRLYQTEAFGQVDLETTPAGATIQTDISGVVQQPVIAKLTLMERPLWRLRYGLQVNDVPDPSGDARNLGPGLAADLERTNLFGRAVTVGSAVRYERSRRAVRGYFLAPRLFNLPVTSSFFVQQQRREDDPVFDYVLSRQVAFEQRFRRGQRVQVQYGYFYRREQFPIEGFDGPTDFVLTFAGLTSAISLDHRDDPFDAKTGWFHASSLQYSSRQLGADSRFLKGTSQQSLYWQIRNSWVVAWNGRLGLAEGLGEDLPRGEGFFTGGGSTVRGYREDGLSPTDAFGQRSGEALFVLNQEFRFPVWSRVAGVVFLDAGNAFVSPTRIRFGELEVGAGVGLRLRTPVGLLRFDFGIPTSRDVGLRAGRWHFAFGQMF